MKKRRNPSSSDSGKAVSTSDALKAAQKIASVARKAGVPFAICGGLAMHLYGFTRATKDIDFLATDPLPLPATRSLSFGGESYTVSIPGDVITVDWIRRSDDAKDMYDLALSDAQPYEETRLLLVTPEWLSIMKQDAGRGKDEMDLLWLLRQPGLVNRTLLKGHLRRLFGKAAYWSIKNMESVFLEADLLRARDERGE